jgi:hypothetical protein
MVKHNNKSIFLIDIKTMTKQKSFSWLRNTILVLAIILVLSYLALAKFPDILNFHHNDLSNDDLFEASIKKDQEQYTAKDLSDITNKELQQKNIDFFYRVFMQNQSQINDLQKEVINLRSDLANYRNSEKIIKIIFSYLDLRQKIFTNDSSISNQSFNNQLLAFRLMISYDKNMVAIFNNLELNLKDFKNIKEVEKMFQAIIPDLIASSKFKKESTTLDDIRYYLAKKVVIRKINQPIANSNDIDSLIFSIEKSFLTQNYIEILKTLAVLSPHQREIVKSFEVEIKRLAELQQIDEEFLNYLKNPI